MTTVPAVRLSKSARRSQLLDVAAELVVRDGVSALTVEGLAMAAGVSKALPYAHFDNAQGVVLALYRREMDGLVRKVEDAIDDGPPGELGLRRAVHAFFDGIAERGAVIAALNRSSAPEWSDGGRRLGPQYVASVLQRTIGIPPEAELSLGTMVLGLLTSAAESWKHHDARRATIEAYVNAFVICGVRAAETRQSG